MVLGSEDLLEIVESIWLPTLQLCTRESTSASSSDIVGMSCRLDVSGDWTGHIVLGCERGLIEVAACKMFDVPAANDQDCKDALSELTNMVAGTVKSFADGDSSLGLPVVDQKGAMPLRDQYENLAIIRCHEHLMCLAVSS